MNWSSKWPDKWPDSPEGLVSDEQAKEIWSAPLSVGIEPLYDASQFANSTLIIVHGHKEYQIPVTIIGDLALEYDEVEGWNIYHVPTLTLFSKAVPASGVDVYVDSDGSTQADDEYEYDKQSLLNWMTKVQQNYPTAWTMLRCLTPETYEDKGQSAKDIILKWCLSVPVV